MRAWVQYWHQTAKPVTLVTISILQAVREKARSEQVRKRIVQGERKKKGAGPSTAIRPPAAPHLPTLITMEAQQPFREGDT